MRLRIVITLVMLSVYCSVICFYISSIQATLSSITPLDTIGANFYWDRACTKKVTDINWGTMSPGDRKEITVYFKANATAVMIMMTQNWNPDIARHYLVPSWNYNQDVINVSQVVQIKFKLSVDPTTINIETFSFSIVVQTIEYKALDINNDRNIDGEDLAQIARAFGTTPDKPKWNAACDINGDGIVDGADLSLCSRHFGDVAY